MAMQEQTKGEKTSLLHSSIEETRKKVKISVLPSITNHIENDKFDHEQDGLDFIETKNGLMISYMIDLTQLLRLKSSKDVDSQKVQECLGRLREMRVVLERIRPLEKKMRYQLDKLLALSASSSSFAAARVSSNAGEQEDERREEADEADPLAFRPNPDSMLGKDDDNIYSENGDAKDASEDSMDGSDDDDDDDDEILAARVALNAGRSKKSSREDDDGDQGVYKAPRLAAVHFTEKEKQSDKEERILKRQRDRMRKSELLSTLKSAYGDAPEEDDFDGGATLGNQREAAQRLSEKEAEKTRYEEATMVRLTPSRKEKKMKNKIMREEVSNLNSIADIGNLTAGVSVAFGDGGKKGRGKEETVRVGGNVFSGRHVNGKRRRDMDESGSSKRDGGAKNSYQRALYGVEGGGKKKSTRRK